MRLLNEGCPALTCSLSMSTGWGQMPATMGSLLALLRMWLQMKWRVSESSGDRAPHAQHVKTPGAPQRQRAAPLRGGPCQVKSQALGQWEHSHSWPGCLGAVASGSSLSAAPTQTLLLTVRHVPEGDICHSSLLFTFYLAWPLLWHRYWKIIVTNFKSKLPVPVFQQGRELKKYQLYHGDKIDAWVNKVYTRTRDSSMEKFYYHMTLSWKLYHSLPGKLWLLSWVEMLFYYMEILQYSCINQVVIMKVSILQYKANPVCEFVTMKMGNHQDLWRFILAGLVKPLLLPSPITRNLKVNIWNPLKGLVWMNLSLIP